VAAARGPNCGGEGRLREELAGPPIALVGGRRVRRSTSTGQRGRSGTGMGGTRSCSPAERGREDASGPPPHVCVTRREEMHSAYRLGWYPKWVRCMGHLLEGDLGRQKHCGRCILGLGPGVGDSLRKGIVAIIKGKKHVHVDALLSTHFIPTCILCCYE
jgi:hypothetical protein